MISKRFTARGIAALMPGPHCDGEGLWLHVSSPGRGNWIARIVVRGKRREMGLGAYPAVGLAEARRLAAEARALARGGRDPIAERRARLATAPTFAECAEAYLSAHAAAWTPKTARLCAGALERYAHPAIGSLPVDRIETDHITRILSPLWTDMSRTAVSLRGYIEQILDYATARGHRSGDNPARWRGHLAHILPSAAKVSRARRHPAMPYRDVTAFYRELTKIGSFQSACLRWLILHASRMSEATGARWSEIDLDAAVWTIPAGRMKAGTEHRIPLSDAAMAMLRELPREAGSDYLFPGARRGRHVSDTSIRNLMRDLGYGPGGKRGEYVAHGFRSSFRDWAGEVSSYPPHICEMALAHSVGSAVEKAYRRGDMIDKRRGLMEEWAKWCESEPMKMRQ